MPRVKKIKKYIPQTEYPDSAKGTRKIMEGAGYTIDKLVELVRNRNTRLEQSYYSGIFRKWDSGAYNATNYIEFWGDSYLDSAYRYVFPETPQFHEVNNKFLEEFDSRDDLKEIYQVATKGRYNVRGLESNFIDLQQEVQYQTRPQSYRMYEEIIEYSTTAKRMIETARETPYREGDLVLLRKPSVGNADYDPMYIPYWKWELSGKTPDDTVPRIGTVVSVTEKIDGYRASKGSKIIKVVWMGVGEGKIYDVPERHLKWHERPTFKNGMKVRE